MSAIWPSFAPGGSSNHPWQIFASVPKNGPHAKVGVVTPDLRYHADIDNAKLLVAILKRVGEREPARQVTERTPTAAAATRVAMISLQTRRRGKRDGPHHRAVPGRQTHPSWTR